MDTKSCYNNVTQPDPVIRQSSMHWTYRDLVITKLKHKSSWSIHNHEWDQLQKLQAAQYNVGT